MPTKKILCLFDYASRTGFGTVSRNIVHHLKKHFGDSLKLDIVAINYFGEPYMEDGNISVVSAKLTDDNNDDFGRYLFMKMLKQSNEYDGIFICQDLGVIVHIVELLELIKKEKKELNRKSFKSIFYFPVDGKLVPEQVKGLEWFDVIATYTEFARNEVLKHRPELRGRIKVVPHGNNPNDFYEHRDDTFRESYFGKNADRFIITNVNRNQFRKDIPNTIFGFIEARNNWDSDLPKPFLYLHMHPADTMGWQLRLILNYAELVEDVDYKLIPKQYEDEMVEVPMLNQIYNASDVFITTTLAGGWELSSTEAMACGIPVILPYHTSLVEISDYGKNAYMLETLYPFCSPYDNNIREQTDIYEIADTLLKVARMKYGKEPSDIEKRVSAAKAWVNKLDWKEVCKQWIAYFREIY